MGHHIDKTGRFQSDKFPNLPPDKIIISFKDKAARLALIALADGYEQIDSELCADIRARLASIA